MSGSRSYDFAPSDIVQVRNFTLGGKPIIEGHAKIVRLLDLPDQYLVKFLSDGMEVERFVTRADQ